MTSIRRGAIIETMRNVTFGIFGEATAGPIINTCVDSSDAVVLQQTRKGYSNDTDAKIKRGLRSRTGYSGR